MECSELLREGGSDKSECARPSWALAWWLLVLFLGWGRERGVRL